MIEVDADTCGDYHEGHQTSSEHDANLDDLVVVSCGQYGNVSLTFAGCWSP